MARFKPGQSGNPNGRPPGTPNKTTDELRQTVQTFLEMNWDTIQRDFDRLDPKDRLNFIERLLKHVLPPPLDELQRLTEDQLNELIERLRRPTFTLKPN